jgi:hypothetical protein
MLNYRYLEGSASSAARTSSDRPYRWLLSGTGFSATRQPLRSAKAIGMERFRRSAR